MTFYILFAMLCTKGNTGALGGMTEGHPSMTQAWTRYFQYKEEFKKMGCKELKSVLVEVSSTDNKDGD